jgi:hypothetical protein
MPDFIVEMRILCETLKRIERLSTRRCNGALMEDEVTKLRQQVEQLLGDIHAVSEDYADAKKRAEEAEGKLDRILKLPRKSYGGDVNADGWNNALDEIQIIVGARRAVSPEERVETAPYHYTFYVRPHRNSKQEPCPINKLHVAVEADGTACPPPTACPDCKTDLLFRLATRGPANVFEILDRDEGVVYDEDIKNLWGSLLESETV